VVNSITPLRYASGMGKTLARSWSTESVVDPAANLRRMCLLVLATLRLGCLAIFSSSRLLGCFLYDKKRYEDMGLILVGTRPWSIVSLTTAASPQVSTPYPHTFSYRIRNNQGVWSWSTESEFLLIALKNIARHPSLRVASTSKHMRLRLAAGSTTLEQLTEIGNKHRSKPLPLAWYDENVA
jgi:hypothetical protein